MAIVFCEEKRKNDNHCKPYFHLKKLENKNKSMV